MAKASARRTVSITIHGQPLFKRKTMTGGVNQFNLLSLTATTDGVNQSSQIKTLDGVNLIIIIIPDGINLIIMVVGVNKIVTKDGDNKYSQITILDGVNLFKLTATMDGDSRRKIMQ